MMFAKAEALAIDLPLTEMPVVGTAGSSVEQTRNEFRQQRWEAIIEPRLAARRALLEAWLADPSTLDNNDESIQPTKCKTFFPQLPSQLPLTQDETIALKQTMTKGCAKNASVDDIRAADAARETLILRNLPFVASEVTRRNHPLRGGLQREDYIQEGCLALMTGVETLDPQKGTITTHVGPKIRSRILKVLDYQGTAIHIAKVPASRLRADLRVVNGPEDLDPELQEVYRLRDCESLDRPIGSDTGSSITIADQWAPNPTESPTEVLALAGFDKEAIIDIITDTFPDNGLNPDNGLTHNIFIQRFFSPEAADRPIAFDKLVELVDCGKTKIGKLGRAGLKVLQTPEVNNRIRLLGL